MKTIAALLTLIGAFASVSKAQLLLDIDPVNETLTFTGSELITPQFDGSANLVRWFFDGPNGSGSEETKVGITSAISATGSTPGYTHFRVFTPTGGVEVWYYLLSGSQVQLNGTGATISYATFNSGAKSVLENLSAGGSIPVVSGIGASAITVNPAAVPEPSSFAALLGVASFACVSLRRRR